MSHDEIVFGEVSYREPRRLRRPDHDRRWTCIAYEVPRPGDLPIFLDHLTADAIERHALRDTSVELGGILLGQECLDDETGQPFVWVTKSLEAKHYENTQSSFTYTHESWEEISRERDRLYPDLDIVGWYHTHPDFGIFLSSHDLFIHRHFFAQPLQVAYVVDPIRQTRGFFQWRQDALDQVGGFFITSDRGDRLALARFVNDLENIPNAGGSGGGGLSPRLEAELIAMLSRPSYPPQAVGAGPSAALFSLVGAVAGVLLLSATLWLGNLGHQVQDQQETLKSIDDTLKRSAAANEKALGAARLEGKQAALDTLLSEVRAGSKPERFVALYEQAIRDRDEARAERDKQTIFATATADANKRLDSQLADASKKLEVLADKARKTEDLQAEVIALKDKLREGSAAPGEGDLARRYLIAWYAAVAGWILFLIALALALVGTSPRPEPGLVEVPRPREEPQPPTTIIS